jgi:uncharacterized protein
LKRAIGKPHPRVLAVDDGAFDRDDAFAPIAALVVSLPSYIEAVKRDRVAVDGRDATDRILALARGIGPLDGVRAVLLDGAVVGGFNVIDLDELHRALGVPVIAVTRRPPDFARIRAALTGWFGRDAARRWRLLRAHPLFPVPTGERPILAAAVGCRPSDAVALIHRSTVRGYWPEPLRMAHLIASADLGSAAPASPTPLARERKIKPRGRRPRVGPVA